MAGRNYQLEFETILHEIGTIGQEVGTIKQEADEGGGLKKLPSLLLHSCCAPCSSYVYSYLKQYFTIFGFYYNPNIAPYQEYAKRFTELEHLVDLLNTQGYEITAIMEPYKEDEFFTAVKGLEGEPEGGKRCSRCFELRLERTAQEASRRGVDFFGTTLTVSSHKNAQVINEIGERLATKYGVRWLPSDFKKKGGYQQSVQLSKEYGLYRQDYCGCIFSKEEAEERKQKSKAKV